jgi:3-hydroxyacyl-CoA dehydrogenase
LRFWTVLQVAAQTGHNVTIVEVNEDALKKANNGIQSSLQRVAKKLHKVYP